MSSGDYGRNPPEWLPHQLRGWIGEHHQALCAIYAEFHVSGEWPSPVELQRRLRARGDRTDVLSAVADMPRVLGHREHAPDRFVLSLFGIGCCPAAHHLLMRYVQLGVLALERFDQPDLPNRLSRNETTAALDLGSEEADRLSRLVVADCPFLAGGNANLADWSLDIDELVLRFEGVESPDEFLHRLAELRSISRQPAWAGATVALATEPGPLAGLAASPPGPRWRQRFHSRGSRALGAVAAALGAVAAVLALAQVPVWVLVVTIAVVIASGIGAVLID